ncbi:serine/threonine-protein phosphatase 2b catalytic subunit 1-related [Anaeramoeba flamelloides]|uniref:Serine/threonine-protein phosphatase 2b catalytic subunit 1-related n=1 Tax=Anaeramoeba flamelloides TaxID=1746091 RepID=A0ABQ8Z2B7_9EUKA|nr:serine/threonine-protein phosphatase 2b catalytic subunit 1-related [Anaeramoeba flamelloides]
MKTCECLPLAAIVDEQFFCVHAGISPHLSDVEMINKIDRFRDPPGKGLFTDLIWSDPFPNYNSSKGSSKRFVFNSPRRCSFQYSYDAVVDFLIENELTCVIRAHEAQDRGYQMYKKWDETNFPTLITIFSAPNYSNSGNKGAVFQYKDRSVTIKEFKQVKEPYSLPDFMDTFEWSVPFITDKILSVWTTIGNLTEEDSVSLMKNKEGTQSKSKENTKQNIYPKDFLNKERIVNIQNKVRVIAKLISTFSMIRKEQKLKINNKINLIKKSKILRAQSANVLPINNLYVSTSEQTKSMQPNVPKLYRSISHESTRFQEKLLKGYTKVWLATQNGKSNFLPKAVYNFNKNEKFQPLDNNEIQLLKRIDSQKPKTKKLPLYKRTNSVHDVIEIMELGTINKNLQKKSQTRKKKKKSQTKSKKKKIIEN